MTAHTFTAQLWEHDPEGTGSWHFVTLPLDTSDDVRAEAGPRRGFGSIRVEVRVGSTTWRTSLFPDAASGSFVLPVKQEVRRAEGLVAGAALRLDLRVLDGGR